MTPFELASGDPLYPAILEQVDHPPQRLWGEGEPRCLTEGVGVAIVGARRCSAYGEEVAFGLARDLSRAGVTVVSGLAYGIDTAAHRGALEGGREGGGGKTIAVLGCGIDVPYPSENQDLKRQIARQGAVITELPPGTRASTWTFPQRNRIISGLSRGVVVVEAGLKSGSLITAELALQQGREVFAVPGNITSPASEGTNRLIQNGAKLVTCVKDILDELGPYQRYLAMPVPESFAGISMEESKVLELLSQGPRQMEELLEESGVPVEKMSSLLVELEIGGKVSSLPGGRFARKK